MRLTKEQLIAAAHAAAKYLPAASADIMKELANRLDVTSVALSEALEQRKALIVENERRGDIVGRLIGQYSAAGLHAVQGSLNPGESLLFDAIQVMGLGKNTESKRGYIVIIQRAWCNESGFGINYDSDLNEFESRKDAIDYGAELCGSDDFNIGVVESGRLVSFDWMDKPVGESPETLAEIAGVLGLDEGTTSNGR